MYMAMDQKIRTFREAKHALYQKGKSRGYFKPKGFGKGKGKKGGKGSAMMVSPNVKGNPKGSGKSMSSGSGSPSNRPGFTGCFICGDLQHDYRNCPKRGSSQGSGSKGGRSIGFVDAVSSDDGHLDANAISAAFMVEEEEQTLMTQDRDHGVENLEHSIMVAKEAFPKHFSLNERLKYAVVDTGATETVGSLDALDVIMKCRSTHFGHEPISIDPHVHKQFRFGNGQTRQSESLVYVPQQVNGRSTGLGVFALDVPEIPVLLGIKTLRRLGAILNTRYDTVEFSSLFPGVIIPLTRGRNGHMLLNLVEDWVPPQYDVVPGQVTVFGTEVPGKENESNTLPLPTLHVDEKGSERETEEQVTHEGRKTLSSGTEVHDSQNVHAQEPADAVAQEVSFRTDVSPESESHAGSNQHGHDQSGSQEPSQGSSQEGVLGGSLGLGSSGRTGSERSQGLRPSLHGKPCRAKSGCNAHGLWTVCGKCSLRLSYTPAVGAKGIYRQSAPLAADTTEVVKEKGNDVTPEDLTTKSIGVDAQERSLLNKLKKVQAEKKVIQQAKESKVAKEVTTPGLETVKSGDQTMQGYPSRKKRENEKIPETQDQEEEWAHIPQTD